MSLVLSEGSQRNSVSELLIPLDVFGAFVGMLMGQKKRNKLFVLLLLSLLVSCQPSSSKLKIPLQWIPGQAVAVLIIDWPQAAADEKLMRMVNGNQLKKTLDSLYIDSETIEQVIVFSDLHESSQTTGIILSGSFQINDLIRYLSAKQWQQFQYRKYSVYQEPRSDFCIAPIRSHRSILLGSKSTVEQTIDAKLNLQPGLADIEPFNRLLRNTYNKRAPVSMVIAFPQNLQDMESAALNISSSLLDLAGLSPLAKLLDAVGFARGIGFSIFHKQNAYPVELMGIMRSEETAANIAGTINLLKGLTTLVPQKNLSLSEREAMESFKTLSVKRDKDILSINLTMRAADFR